MTTNALKERMLALGADQARLDGYVNDVSEIILRKMMDAGLRMLPEQELKMITAFSPEELARYVEKHPDFFPRASIEELQKIIDQTLESYFEAL